MLPWKAMRQLLSLKLMRKSILSIAKDCALFNFASLGPLLYIVGEMIIARGRAVFRYVVREIRVWSWDHISVGAKSQFYPPHLG